MTKCGRVVVQERHRLARSEKEETCLEPSYPSADVMRLDKPAPALERWEANVPQITAATANAAW